MLERNYHRFIWIFVEIRVNLMCCFSVVIQIQSRTADDKWVADFTNYSVGFNNKE